LILKKKKERERERERERETGLKKFITQKDVLLTVHPGMTLGD